MENVTITETRRDKNPKYIINDLGIEIRVELRKQGNSAQIRMKHDDINASEIYGRFVERNIHEIYLKSLPREQYPTFCEGLIVSINILAEQGLSVPQIAKALYNQYQNNENIKMEITDIRKEFKKLNDKYERQLAILINIKEDMEDICRQMEML